MKVINQIVDSITKLGMGVSALVVFVITFLQVLFRYVLKSPLAWSQVNAILEIIASTLITGAVGVALGKAHLLKESAA